jgi:hypothetical protein
VRCLHRSVPDRPQAALEGRGYDPPDVAWAEPEPADGADPLKPPELALPEVLEPEPAVAEPPEVPEAAEDAEAVPGEADLCVDPGRMRDTTPAMTTLPMPATVVVARSLLRPRLRAATACEIENRCRLLMLKVSPPGIRASCTQLLRQL